LGSLGFALVATSDVVPPPHFWTKRLSHFCLFPACEDPSFYKNPPPPSPFPPTHKTPRRILHLPPSLHPPSPDSTSSRFSQAFSEPLPLQGWGAFPREFFSKHGPSFLPHRVFLLNGGGFIFFPYATHLTFRKPSRRTATSSGPFPPPVRLCW